MRVERLNQLSGLVGLAMLCGCAPQRTLETPQGWPLVWSERMLYHTPNAYIYASSPAAAGEADRIAGSVAREFERRTDGRAGKCLLIVSDTRDQPVIGDLKLFLRLSSQKEAFAHLASMPSPEEKEKQITEALASEGVDPEIELMMRTISLHPSDLSQLLGFAPAVTDTVDWALVLPTRTLVEQVSRQIMEAQLEERGIGPVAQIAFYPFLEIQKFRMVSVGAARRHIALFEHWANDQEAWSLEQREERTAAYRRRKLDEVTRPLLTLIGDVLRLVAEPIANIAGSPGQQAPSTPSMEVPD